MEKRQIAIRDFVADIRSGVSDQQLMLKYGLDAWGLRNALKKMLEIKAIRKEDLVAGKLRPPAATEIENRRQFPRNYILFSLPVYDAEDIQVEGFVNDINEQGLQVTGIPARKGDHKSLLIRADEFADIFPFVFDTVCRWTSAGSEDGEFVAGFDIRFISTRGLEELRKLVSMLAFEWR
jgi:hypothetical protein